jgi:hypothetical protein
MNKSLLMVCSLCIALSPIFLSPTYAAENGVAIPKIASEPSFADFPGMSAGSELSRSMAKVDDFIQREPDDGDAATQRTEVYLGYDQEYLYAIFLAFDTNPALIRANLSSRENIDGDDTVGLTIDTFNDQRTAFTFRSTPYGIQWDARWTEGSSRRAGFDTTFEAVWDSEGQLTDQGYIVKMAIPLRSLRFPDSSDQLWRVQFARDIPRLSEKAYWPSYSIDIEGRLNQTAMLTGIKDVSPGNNSQIIPFIFARDVDALDLGATGGPRFDKSAEQDLGVDAKFVFNDSMVLDLTLNPDFSQVESDQPQVTVNERFEVEFPESRPFFVENADFFSTDSNLVFTRRIVDPEGGLRFTGRSGQYGFGAIAINDEAPGLNRSANDPLNGEKANIGILRGFRDISDQSRVGFLLTDRELGDGFNRVASVDGRFKLTDNWITNMQFVGTESEPALGGESTTGYQRNIQVNRTGRTVNTHSHFIETTDNFRTELGFQNRFFRPDVSGIHNRLTLNFYPENSSINSWSAGGMDVYLKDTRGTRLYHEIRSNFNLNFDTTGLGLSYIDYSEVLRPQDFAGIMTNQRFDYANAQVSFNNNTLDKLEFSISYRLGETLNLVPAAGSLPTVADTNRTDIDLLWRPFDRLRVANTYLLTQLETRGSGTKIFNNKIIRSNWNYQFTKELSLRFIAQYEETDAGPASVLTDDKNLNFDLLMRYVINPWSAFYVGYNSNQSNFDIVEMEGDREVITVNDLKRDGNQLFVKFSYLFQR